MSFNRLTYDNCAYSTSVKESVSSLDYNLNVVKYENCKSCPACKYNTNVALDARADVESELFGLDRPGTKCPGVKFDPTKKYNNPKYSPPQLCQSIYYITPNNLVKPTTNLLNENNLGINYCDKK